MSGVCGEFQTSKSETSRCLEEGKDGQQLGPVSEYIQMRSEMTERQASEVQRAPSPCQCLLLLLHKMNKCQDKADTFVVFYECVHLTS